jgi:hypothetical protein
VNYVRRASADQRKYHVSQLVSVVRKQSIVNNVLILSGI